MDLPAKPKRTADVRAEEQAVRSQHAANPVRQPPAERRHVLLIVGVTPMEEIADSDVDEGRNHTGQREGPLGRLLP
jgi:hypothetical protein